jgi:MFS family permease
VLTIGGIAYGLAQSMIIPALPDIERATHSSSTTGAWLLTAYLLAAAGLTAIVGRLGDMLGHRRVLVAALLTFAAGAGIDAVSTNLVLLVVGRVVQAAGAGVYPLAFAILRERIPPSQLAPAVGLMSATLGIGGGVGPLVGGLLVQYGSYQWMFAALAILTLGAAVLTRLFVPSVPAKAAERIDWPGAALLTAALVMFLLAVNQGPSWGWGDARTVGLLFASGLLFPIWIVVERRTAAPLVDIAIMRRYGMVIANSCGFCVGWTSYVGMLLITLEVQQPSSGIGLGWGATAAGALLVPSGLAILLVGRAAGSMSQRMGPRRPLILGAALTLVPTALLSVLDHQIWFLIAASMTFGAAGGLSLGTLPNLVIETVPPGQTGVAAGMNTLVRIAGAAIGAQVVVTIIASHTIEHTNLYANDGFVIGFLLTAVLCVVNVAVAALAPRRERVGGSPGSTDAGGPGSSLPSIEPAPAVEAT